MLSRNPQASSGFTLRLIGSLASTLLLLLLLRQQGWTEITRAFHRMPIWCILIAFGAILTSRLATALRWHVLLRALDVPISLKQTVSLTFAGLFAANFLPTTVGGDIARLAGAMQMKLSSSRCTAALVMDRLVGMLGMLMAVPLALPAFLKTVAVSQALHHAGALTLTPAMGTTTDKPKSFMVRLRSLISSSFKEFLNCARCPYHLLAALACTWVHILGFSSATSLLFRGQSQVIPFGLIVGLWGMVYFFTLIPLSINGLGLQELSITYLFTHVAGVPTISAITAAILVRAFTVLCSLPGAAFMPSVVAGKSQQPIQQCTAVD